VIRVAAATAVLLALVGSGVARAATLQQVGVFAQPMYVTSAPADPNRLFVVERAGEIEQVQGGAVSNFADLSSQVSCCVSERGLLSIAIAPNFATSGRFYVAYTGFAGEIHVAEMRASGRSAPLSSLRDLLVIPHADFGNHNGGQLQFGPDGHLYVSTGDGGGKNDELQNAQSLDSLLGKILRIDPEPSGLLAYTVPAGNPYPGLETPYDTIWSTGLRNPYRFSFDRQGGAMLIGDVGQDEREEVDYAAPGAPGGANYGWNCVEGGLPGPGTDPECASPPPGGYTDPIFEYPHDNPGGGAATGCAIVGGYVVRDRSLDGLFGRYVYGDYCAGEVRSFSLSDPEETDRFEGLVVPEMTSFGEDSCGRLYVASRAGRVSRLVNGVDPCPQVVPRSRSFIGIKAQNGRVKRHRRALITAFVSPCAGRRGEAVKLFRGRQHLGTRHLDRACSVRFRPKISRKTNFRALIGEDANYEAATSRKLRIKILNRKPRRR
jgi:hypothetical protein